MVSGYQDLPRLSRDLMPHIYIIIHSSLNPASVMVQSMVNVNTDAVSIGQKVFKLPLAWVQQLLCDNTNTALNDNCKVLWRSQ